MVEFHRNRFEGEHFTAYFRGAALILPLLCLLLASAPRPARGQSQTTSAIRGSVLSSDGAPLDGVQILLRHLPTGTERSTITDDRGRFVLLLLQPGGPYSVRAVRIGYAESQEDAIQLQVGETHTVELTLEVQAVQVEGVSVSVEQSAIFNPTLVGPATLLGERMVEAIPLPSRDIMDLAVLSPLVRTTEGGGFSVAGQNDRYNSILVDGLLNQDAFGLTPGGVPGGQAGAKLLPLDAVAQYEILVAPYDARLSGFAGGVMNTVTKTGTNDWRTGAFAVGRHEALMGDLNLQSGSAEASGIKRTLLGLSVGGPIIKDRAHFFLAGEFEERQKPPSGYNLGRDSSSLVGIEERSLEAYGALFEDLFGLDIGRGDAYPLTQSLANIFARIDWAFSNGSRLTARNIYARASNDEAPNRYPFMPYELSTNAVNRTSSSNTLSVQYFSELGKWGGNEIDLTFNRTTDRTTPASSWPQVEAVLLSPSAFFASNRALRSGAQFFAQANDLSQTSLRLSNTLTLATGRNTWSLGIQGTWFDIQHTFLPGAAGEYLFSYWPDVEDNAPQRFQQTVLEDGQDPGISFDVAQAGAFVQNLIEVGHGLTLRVGLRMDIPFALDRPEENETILRFFGRSTAEVPSGMVLFSPRIGFNWQGGRRLRTQLRGGAGIFTGQLPYVWLANSFHNTGLRSVTRVCEGRRTDDPIISNTAPPFDPTAVDPTCLAGAPDLVRVVNLFEEGFKYPQFAKFSAAVDQELTSSLSASVGFIFSHSINQILLRELNITPREDGLLSLTGYGGTDRTRFGVPTDDGYRALRLVPGYEQVLMAMNGRGDRAWSLSAELRGSLFDRLGFQFAYAYARSYDRMSMGSVDLISNYGLTPTHGDPNDPPLTPSNFDRPHKVVLVLYGTPIPRLRNTEVSLLYTGESGLPYSYVYGGDINGDGYPFPGPASDKNNDLLWVPRDAEELPSSFATYTRLAAALTYDPCLEKFVGGYITRNGCRAPWQNRLDLRVSQKLIFGGADLSLEADILNLLNLLNSDWGLIQTIPPVSELLAPQFRQTSPGETGALLSEWSAGVLPLWDDDGVIIPPDPWSVVSPASQWQVQFGVRAIF